jgi:hypothetical protein
VSLESGTGPTPASLHLRLVPPTAWGVPARDEGAELAPRLCSLDGIVIGLLANGKANGDRILDLVADDLATRHRIADVIRCTKPHPSLPMGDEVLMMFAERAHAVLTAVGD